jgi:hypothetical protein
MKLPKSFTTVTPFSKLLALSLFVIFPIIGFFLGVTYQKTVTPLPPQIPLESTLPLRNQKVTPTEAANAQPVPGNGRMCTQEAKQCPDGSYVSRTGPHCEFAKCPSAR